MNQMDHHTIRGIEHLLERHKNKGFSGVVCIDLHACMRHSATCIQDGMPVASSALGSDTAFGLASAGKLLTALAIFQLIEQGRMALRESARQYLPSELHVPPEVSVWHLLTHTSGMQEFFDECAPDGYGELWRRHPVYNFRDPTAYLPLLTPLGFSEKDLGRFAYKNSAYILLGMMVEQVSGSKFTAYVQQHIIERAGMNNSGYFESDSLPLHAQPGWIPANNQHGWRTNIFAMPPQGGGEGGAYCTPSDMARLWHAIVQGEILGGLTSAFLSPQVQDGCDGEWHYAYGYWINQVGDALRYVSVGEDPGCSVRYSFHPANGMGVGVFCNVGARAGGMSADLHALLFPGICRKAAEPATLLTCSTALCDGMPPTQANKTGCK